MDKPRLLVEDPEEDAFNFSRSSLSTHGYRSKPYPYLISYPIK